MAEPQPPQTEEKKDEAAIPDKPMLGIDPLGNMTVFIPLRKTGEIFARGFVDVARTEMMKWYVAQAQQQREAAALATKTGFQRFKDKLLRK